MPELRHHLYTYSILFVAVTLNACAAPSYWPEVQGRVLDETTNLPIEGAIVVARWRGYGSHAFIQTRSICYHIETVTTDKQGRFTFSTRMDGISTVHEKFVAYRVYKAGYVISDKTYKKEIYKKNLKYLKFFKGTNEERLKYLHEMANVIRCADADDFDKKTLFLYEEMYEEAKSLSETQQEMEYVEKLLFILEYRKFGGDEARKRKETRMRNKYEAY